MRGLVVVVVVVVGVVALLLLLRVAGFAAPFSSSLGTIEAFVFSMQLFPGA